MILLSLLVYIVVTYALYKWLQPGQFASVFSNLGLIFICMIWPFWAVWIIVNDIWFAIWYGIFPVEPRKWEDVKSADSSPKKKTKVDPE